MAQDGSAPPSSRDEPATATGLQKKLPRIVAPFAAEQARAVRLMFQDEARFGRINDPSRCWASRGLRPEVPAQIVREYTCRLGAVSPQDGTLDTLILPDVHAEAMSLFLAEVALYRENHPDLVALITGFDWIVNISLSAT